jgi:hypothetical protein
MFLVIRGDARDALKGAPSTSEINQRSCAVWGDEQIVVSSTKPGGGDLDPDSVR